MEERMEVLRFLLLLTVTVALSSAVPHIEQFFYTGVSPETKCPEFFAEGRIDGEQFEYCDSNIKTFIPKTDWMKNLFDEDSDYWIQETQNLQYYQETFNVNVSRLMQLFNQTKGLHTVQVTYGCELSDDGTKSGFARVGYDGEDFLFMDMNTTTWSAVNPQAQILKQLWEKNSPFAYPMLKTYLETECFYGLQQLVIYGKSSLERKVSPKVDLFQRGSSSPVVCHATGFFPKAVMISWQKNGEDLHEDVELRETVPNNDGTFQIRSILNKSPEELRKHNYTCVVQHSSQEDLVLYVDKRRILSGPDGVPVPVIAGAVVAVLLLFFPAVVLWKRKSSSNFPSFQGRTSPGLNSPCLQVWASSGSRSPSLEGRGSPGSSSPSLHGRTSPASEGDGDQVSESV